MKNHWLDPEKQICVRCGLHADEIVDKQLKCTKGSLQYRTYVRTDKALPRIEQVVVPPVQKDEEK